MERASVPVHNQLNYWPSLITTITTSFLWQHGKASNKQTNVTYWYEYSFSVSRETPHIKQGMPRLTEAEKVIRESRFGFGTCFGKGTGD